MAIHEHGELGCGRRGAGAGRGGREPFAFPGTERVYAPDRDVDVVHVRLEVQLDPRVTALAGCVTHEFHALAEDTRRVRLHAGELTVERVEDEEGRALAFRHAGESLEIELAAPLGFGDRGEVRIRYRAVPRRGIYFIHPDAGYPDKPHQAWTQGQDEDSRYWFPCFDHPIEKFSSEVLARVPRPFTAVSNGALIDRTEHEDGTVTWHWKQEAEHSAYLVTLCVAEFEELSLGESPVPMPAFVPLGMRARAERALGRTAAMVAHFAERFGVDYPYEKYAQVVVEDFIFGGMENTSATTLIDLVLYDDRAALDFDRDDLVAHELAHQWWGDLLTCREWPHAWLNEGFATWCQALWREHAEGPDAEAYERHGWLAHYLAEDGGEYRRAIVDRRFQEPIDLFDRHLYEKGGLVLHMLRKELGEDAFWRALRTYAQSNRGGSVITEDLRAAIEAATGRNLDAFFDQWVYHAGHPELTVSWKHDAGAGRLAVTVRQTQKTAEEMFDVFRFGVRVEAHGRGAGGVPETVGDRFQVTRREHTFTLACAWPPERVEVDPQGDLLAPVKLEQPAAASRATLASDAPLVARIRAARALVDEPTGENVAALAAPLTGGFWGLAVECAQALAGMRTPAARDALLAALPRCEHPKARRGIVEALGAFRHDAQAGAAVLGVLRDGDPSMFVEAAAAAALGRTRVPGAREALEEALAHKDAWYETIRIGCVNGLAALGDEGVLPALVACTAYGRHPRLRGAAARALGAVGRRLARREPVLETLADLAQESDLRAVVAAVEGLRTMGDERALPVLAGAPARHPDGRARRVAKAAALRIAQGEARSAELARLADAVEALRVTNGKLLQRVESLESRLATTGASTIAPDGPAA